MLRPITEVDWDQDPPSYMLSNTCVESQDSLGLHSPASFTFCIVCPQSGKAQRLLRPSLTRFLRAHDITRKPDVEMVQHNSPTPFSTEKKPEEKPAAMRFRKELIPGSFAFAVTSPLPWWVRGQPRCTAARAASTVSMGVAKASSKACG